MGFFAWLLKDEPSKEEVEENEEYERNLTYLCELWDMTLEEVKEKLKEIRDRVNEAGMETTRRELARRFVMEDIKEKEKEAKKRAEIYENELLRERARLQAQREDATLKRKKR